MASLTSLDFSQAKVQAIGVAFTAMKTTVNTKTKQQLEEEEGIGQSSDTSMSKSYKASNVQDKAISLKPNEQTVLFADPTNGAFVKLNLSNENIDKLKKHFVNESDFFEKKDGSLRLNGEAEAFVSGWFGDIAYKREFLRADADGNNSLSKEEFQNSKGSFWVEGKADGVGRKVFNVSETITESYASRNDSLGGRHYSDSIQTAINKTIKADSNFDGQETYKEAFDGEGLNYVKDIIQYAQKVLGNIDDNRPNPLEDKTDAELELLLLQAKALQKLRASNGDENTLTVEEKKALGGELASLKKQFDKQEDLSSIKQELKEKIESTQFIDVRA